MNFLAIARVRTTASAYRRFGGGYIYFINTLSRKPPKSICGLVAMTSASHAEGRQFDPGQMYAKLLFIRPRRQKTSAGLSVVSFRRELARFVRFLATPSCGNYTPMRVFLSSPSKSFPLSGTIRAQLFAEPSVTYRLHLHPLSVVMFFARCT